MKKRGVIILDIFLHIFHVSFIVFLLVGWIFPATRILNLLAVMATAFCWVVLGFFKGFGYCPVVDVHNKVRVARGHGHFRHSYMKHIIDLFIDFDLGKDKVDKITYVGFIAVATVSCIVNVIPYL